MNGHVIPIRSALGDLLEKIFKTFKIILCVPNIFKDLRPSHTGGKTGCRPPTTKKVANHQRPSATIGQKKCSGHTYLWSSTSVGPVVRPVGDKLEWSAKTCHRTVGDGRRWAAIDVRWAVEVVGRSPDKRGPVADRSLVLKTKGHTSHDHCRWVADLVKTS